MKIGLHYGIDESQVRGPHKVVHLLKKSLSKIGHEVCQNSVQGINGCLNSEALSYRTLPVNAAMGPNLFVIPSDDNNACSTYNNFIVPCQWVKNKYNTFECMKNKNIYVWPVGIDCDMFYERPIPTEVSCLIYFKNRDEAELKAVTDILNLIHIKYNIIRYGFYSEKEFINALSKSSFSIVLDNTESQGIAIMEMMSMNVPLFVLDKEYWNHYPATTVPYFDESCGRIYKGKVDDACLHRLSQFLENLNKFNPRSYILENHSLSKSAARYVEILLECHK